MFPQFQLSCKSAVPRELTREKTERSASVTDRVTEIQKYQRQLKVFETARVIKIDYQSKTRKPSRMLTILAARVKNINIGKTTITKIL